MIDTKGATASKTVWVFGAQLLVAVLLLLLHYAGVAELGPDVLVTAWVGAVVGVQGIGLRLVTRTGLSVGRPGRGSGSVLVALMVAAGPSACSGTMTGVAERAGSCLAACAGKCAVSCAGQLVDDLLCRPLPAELTPIDGGGGGDGDE